MLHGGGAAAAYDPDKTEVMGGAAAPRTPSASAVVVTKLLVVTCSPNVKPDPTLVKEVECYRGIAAAANSAADKAAGMGAAATTIRRVELVEASQITALSFASLFREHTGEAAVRAARASYPSAEVTVECVFVLSGHGDVYLRAAAGGNTFGFISEEEAGKLSAVEPEALVLALRGARADWQTRGQGRVRLVLLNGCETAPLARALAKAGVADTVGWETRVDGNVAGPLFGAALVKAVAAEGAPLEGAFATARAAVLMRQQPGRLDPTKGGGHAADVPAYALHDPDDFLTVGVGCLHAPTCEAGCAFKLKDDTQSPPRFAGGVPMLATKAASVAAKDRALKVMFGKAGVMVGSGAGSDDVLRAAEAAGAAKEKKLEKMEKKLRRAQLEEEVTRRMTGESSTTAGTGTAVGSSTTAAASPAAYTAEEAAWIEKKVAKRTARMRAQFLGGEAEKRAAEARLTAVEAAEARARLEAARAGAGGAGGAGSGGAEARAPPEPPPSAQRREEVMEVRAEE